MEGLTPFISGHPEHQAAMIVIASLQSYDATDSNECNRRSIYSNRAVITIIIEQLALYSSQAIY